MEINFTVYNKMGSTTEIICCGKSMTYREQKGKHWNDNPHTFRCKNCGKWLKGNSHAFDVPRPKHITVILKEVKSKK